MCVWTVKYYYVENLYDDVAKGSLRIGRFIHDVFTNANYKASGTVFYTIDISYVLGPREISNAPISF